MNMDRTERRIAAILAADIAGYSQLTGSDACGTPGTASSACRRTPGVGRDVVRRERYRVMLWPAARSFADDA